MVISSRLLLFCALGFASAASAQSKTAAPKIVEAAGYVVEQSAGLPRIREARVMLKAADAADDAPWLVTLTLDKNSRWSTQLPQLKYKMRIEACGYEPLEKVIDLHIRPRGVQCGMKKADPCAKASWGCPQPDPQMCKVEHAPF